LSPRPRTRDTNLFQGFLGKGRGELRDPRSENTAGATSSVMQPNQCDKLVTRLTALPRTRMIPSQPKSIRGRRSGELRLHLGSELHLAVNGWSLRALAAWAGLVCLLIVVTDSIPDTEQFEGALVEALPAATSGDATADLPISRTVAGSLADRAAYLALLFRSPPANS